MKPRERRALLAQLRRDDVIRIFPSFAVANITADRITTSYSIRKHARFLISWVLLPKSATALNFTNVGRNKGYDETVIPEIQNPILSQHDFILLGLRGQAKTKILRDLVNLLDPFIPIIAGSEINDNPFNPISQTSREKLLKHGDDTPIEWIPSELRYNEKLATPDVSIADLFGDIDPIKAASKKLSYADEGAIHYGIIPRTNRGIFVINELPDLQPRIQVGLLNILEEKDLQIRGYPIRIPLDIVVFKLI